MHGQIFKVSIRSEMVWNERRSQTEMDETKKEIAKGSEQEQSSKHGIETLFNIIIK